jgi:hypothetical protein
MHNIVELKFFLIRNYYQNVQKLNFKISKKNYLKENECRRKLKLNLFQMIIWRCFMHVSMNIVSSFFHGEKSPNGNPKINHATCMQEFF